MRTYIPLVFLVACSTSGPTTRSTARAGQAASDAAMALIQNDYARALDIADRALASSPDDPWLLYNKGVAEAGIGRVEAALDTLRRSEARFRDPHDRSLATYRRALALEFVGRCAESSTELSHYAQLVRAENPRLGDEALAHLKFCVGPTAQEVAEREEAAALRASAPSQSVRRAEDLSTKSVESMVAGDYAMALAKAVAGLELVPDDPWLVYNKGVALAGLGRESEAEATLRQAERMFSPSNIHGRSVAVYRRALTFEMAGRCDEEAAELKHYAELTRSDDADFAAHMMAHVRLCKAAHAHRAIY